MCDSSKTLCVMGKRQPTSGAYLLVCPHTQTHKRHKPRNKATQPKTIEGDNEATKRRPKMNELKRIRRGKKSTLDCLPVWLKRVPRAPQTHDEARDKRVFAMITSKSSVERPQHHCSAWILGVGRLDRFQVICALGLSLPKALMPSESGVAPSSADESADGRCVFLWKGCDQCVYADYARSSQFEIFLLFSSQPHQWILPYRTAALEYIFSWMCSPISLSFHSIRSIEVIVLAHFVAPRRFSASTFFLFAFLRQIVLPFFSSSFYDYYFDSRLLRLFRIFRSMRLSSFLVDCKSPSSFNRHAPKCQRCCHIIWHLVERNATQYTEEHKSWWRKKNRIEKMAR